MDWQDRTRRVLGDKGTDDLKTKHVAVFGLGGVGGYAVEALARAGVGRLTLIDADKVDITNLNRQIIAVTGTIGRDKCEVCKERVLSINPLCEVTALNLFYGPENADIIDFTAFDYVADCIDSVGGKLKIIEKCKSAGVPVISCMGTGNKVDPSALKICDISKTSVCPLARVMRRELRSRGIDRVETVFSTEIPITDGQRAPGSVSFVPGAAGLLIAGKIIRELTGVTPSY